MCELSLYKAVYKIPGQALMRVTNKDLSVVMNAPRDAELISMYRWDMKQGWVEVYRLAFVPVPTVTKISKLGMIL